MRVSANYYNESTYHRHETVKRIVIWCNDYMKQCKQKNDTFSSRIAHQIKCLVIKRYSKTNNLAFIPLCADWETDPLCMVAFIWERKAREPKRLDLIKGSKEYSPETII